VISPSDWRWHNRLLVVAAGGVGAYARADSWWPWLRWAAGNPRTDTGYDRAIEAIIATLTTF
jgi:hypothetical protein